VYSESRFWRGVGENKFEWATTDEAARRAATKTFLNIVKGVLVKEKGRSIGWAM